MRAMGGKIGRRASGIKVYQYPRCSTCRKAMRWMEEHGVGYASVDIVESPPSVQKLRDMWKRSGLPVRKLFNTSGQSYREGGYRDKLESMTDAQALAALAADGKLIKRPLVDTGDAVLVGFDAGAYEGTLLQAP